jgi:hypothetical protein
MEAGMSQILLFPNRRHVVLRDALVAAEASVTRNFASVDWLKRNGASLAEQVKASLNFNAALHHLYQCKDALAQLQRATQG